MTKKPISIDKDALAVKALSLMNEKKITSLCVHNKKKKQKTIELKEIKFRPNTDKHDYEVKMRSVTKFLENGDKVKITLRFRGREMAHQELGAELMERVAVDTAHLGKPDVIPKVEGRQMVMIIYPNI